MLETHGFTPPWVDAIQEWLSSLGITTRNNYRVQYHGHVYDENLIVAGYYHMNTKTNVLGKYFNFINRVMVMNSSWYKKTMYVYQKKRQQSALSARAISFTIKAT